MTDLKNAAIQDSGKKRESWIDIAKCIAIIAIMLGHCGSNSVNRVVFYFHVPIFYICSGFFMKVDQPINIFIRKRARQLLLPYGIASVVIVVFSTIREAVLGGDWASELKNIVIAALYGAGDTWQDPFYVEKIGALWFLLALFWGGIIAKIALQNLKRWLFPLLALAFFGIWSARYIWLPENVQAGVVAAVYIVLGNLIYKNGILDGKLPVIAFLFSAVAWAAGIWKFNGFWLVHNYFGNGVMDFFVSLCAVYCIFFIAKFFSKYRRVTGLGGYLGKNTLEILCFHDFEMMVIGTGLINALLSRVGVGYPVTRIAQMLWRVVFPVICVLIYNAIKKALRKRVNG